VKQASTLIKQEKKTARNVQSTLFFPTKENLNHFMTMRTIACSVRRRSSQRVLVRLHAQAVNLASFQQTHEQNLALIVPLDNINQIRVALCA
jgi:hypothetical protein